MQPPVKSDPRVSDTLANERTFLAYARTALAFIGFGFVIARFSLFAREFQTASHLRATTPVASSLFGTIMALAGVACGAYGAYRYVTTARAIERGTNRALPTNAAISIAVVIALIGAIVTATLIAYR